MKAGDRVAFLYSRWNIRGLTTITTKNGNITQLDYDGLPYVTYRITYGYKKTEKARDIYYIMGTEE